MDKQPASPEEEESDLDMVLRDETSAQNVTAAYYLDIGLALAREKLVAVRNSLLARIAQLREAAKIGKRGEK